MPDGLAAFLTARLDDAETLARAAIQAGDGTWTQGTSMFDPDVTRPGDASVSGDDLFIAKDGDNDIRLAHAVFIAANDPARTLRGIAGKRAILAAHKTTITKRETYPFSPATGEPIPAEHDGDCEICGWFYPEQGGCLTMRHLAAEWDDHPAYQSGWSPEPATAP